MSLSQCLSQVALVALLAVGASPASAQYAPQVQPECSCGPSAFKAYAPSYPQPAYRPLDGSARRGVTYRDGDQYRAPRTYLGTSAYEPVTAPAYWGGSYIGVHLGYGFGSAEINDARLGSFDTGGAFAGIHLGNNWQLGAFVLGVEADISKSWAEGRKTFATGFDPLAEREWAGSLRARAGVSLGNFLVYGTAGVAAAHSSVLAPLGGTTWRGPEVNIGKVYGAGLEWQILPRMSLRGEVLRYDYTPRDMQISGAVAPTKLGDTVVRGGLSFRLN